MMSLVQLKPPRTPKKREKSYCTWKSFCFMFWPIRLLVISFRMSAGELELCNRVVGGNVAMGESSVAEPGPAAVKKLLSRSRKLPATLKLRKRKVSTNRSLSLRWIVPVMSAEEVFQRAFELLPPVLTPSWLARVLKPLKVSYS